MWIEMVVDGLLGAVAGMVGWFVTRRLGGEQLKKSLIPAVCVAIAVVVGNQEVVPVVRAHRERRDLYEAGLGIYGNPGVAAAFVEAMAPIMRHPGLRAWLSKDPGASGALAAVPADGTQGAFALLTAKGMARVSPTELEALFDAKRKLAELSPELCAGFWSGGIPAGQLMGGIRRLPEAEQLVWIRTTAAAMRLELEGRTPPRPPDEGALTKAMGKLVDALPDAERAALVKASAGGAITPEEACAAFRALAGGVKKLSPEGRDAVIWGVSSPNAT